MAILFYNLVVLTSLIATAIRDLDCDDEVCPLNEELNIPAQTRPPMAKPTDTWRRRILYAAAAVTSACKSQGVHSQPASDISTQNNEQFGRRSSSSSRSSNSSNTTDASNFVSDACSEAHGLELYQENTTSYLEGLPIFHVTVTNTCLDCSVQDIHIACEDWASATEVNPLVFKRVAYNDCVVNDGKPISSQGVIFFEYTNSFPYPMHVQSSSPSC